MFTCKHRYGYIYSCHCFPQKRSTSARVHRLALLNRPRAVYRADKRHVSRVIAFLIRKPSHSAVSCFSFVSLLTAPATTRGGVWRSGPRRPRSHGRSHLSHLPQVLVCCSHQCAIGSLIRPECFICVWTGCRWGSYEETNGLVFDERPTSLFCEPLALFFFLCPISQDRVQGNVLSSWGYNDPAVCCMITSSWWYFAWSVLQALPSLFQLLVRPYGGTFTLCTSFL